MPRVNASSQLERSDTLLAAGRALFRLGRFFHRQGVPHSLTGQTAEGVELSHILAVQAVEAVQAEGKEATVGRVAGHLGHDPSTTSRVVAASVQSGLLKREASQQDGRRSLLELTPKGQALADGAAAFQRSVFASMTEAWTEEEREVFANLFVRFVEDVANAYKQTDS